MLRMLMVVHDASQGKVCALEQHLYIVTPLPAGGGVSNMMEMQEMQVAIS